MKKKLSFLISSLDHCHGDRSICEKMSYPHFLGTYKHLWGNFGLLQNDYSLKRPTLTREFRQMLSNELNKGLRALGHQPDRTCARAMPVLPALQNAVFSSALLPHATSSQQCRHRGYCSLYGCQRYAPFSGPFRLGLPWGDGDPPTRLIWSGDQTFAGLWML